MKKMNLEMLKGLSKDTNPTAKVKMIPSYVTHLPDGSGINYFSISIVFINILK